MFIGLLSKKRPELLDKLVNEVGYEVDLLDLSNTVCYHLDLMSGRITRPDGHGAMKLVKIGVSCGQGYMLKFESLKNGCQVDINNCSAVRDWYFPYSNYATVDMYKHDMLRKRYEPMSNNLFFIKDREKRGK